MGAAVIRRATINFLNIFTIVFLPSFHAHFLIFLIYVLYGGEKRYRFCRQKDREKSRLVRFEIKHWFHDVDHISCLADCFYDFVRRLVGIWRFIQSFGAD